MVIFFLDRLALSSFGLAMAVNEFSAAVDDPCLVARRSDPALITRMNLRPIGLWQALTDRRRVWHIDDMFAPFCLSMTLLGLLLGRHVVICPHGMLDRWALRTRRFRTKLAILSLINITARVGKLYIHALNPQEARKARLLLSHARQINTVPNAIPRDILESRSTLAGHSPTGPQLVIGCMSRIARKKNQIALVDLAVGLRQMRPEVFALCEFRIDGAVEDETYVAEIVDAIAKANLGGQIRLGGPVSFEKRGEVLASYDVFFFPSKSEGMPYVVLEAMALGRLPLVSSTSSSGFVAGYGGLVYRDIDEAIALLPASREALEARAPDTARFIADYGPGHFAAFLEDCTMRAA